MRKILIAILAVAVGQFVWAQETGKDTYTIQRLLIYNEKGEVLLEKNDFGWMTPALRHNSKASIKQGLAQLASEYNLSISSPMVAGIFMFVPNYKPISQFRQHYRCKKVDGSLVVPENKEDARWFTISKAAEMMSLPDTKAPVVIGEMTKQLLYYPESLWGGTFELSKDKTGKISHTIIENYYTLR
ncbi:hypothetical protein [uncultured Croceitalea sp.]|uniref:hypothetical protein n=1 Tax=uncultured Croceitalea sp. TaxID=1798908 RepID=UPI00374F0F33